MAGKADIVEHLVNSVEGLTKKQANEAFDTLMESLTKMVLDGERVILPGFGSFSISERQARTGRNPATGAQMTIPASRTVRFKPGKELKVRLNG